MKFLIAIEKNSSNEDVKTAMYPYLHFVRQENEEITCTIIQPVTPHITRKSCFLN